MLQTLVLSTHSSESVAGEHGAVLAMTAYEIRLACSLMRFKPIRGPKFLHDQWMDTLTLVLESKRALGRCRVIDHADIPDPTFLFLSQNAEKFVVTVIGTNCTCRRLPMRDLCPYLL